MPKPRVLLFTDWFYPGFMAGGTIQASFNLINAMKGLADFSVVTRDADYTGTAPYPGVKSDKWNILTNGMRVFYFSKARLTYSGLTGLIGEESFDIAYLNGLYSPRLTLMPLFILRKLSKKTILAPRGMLAPSAIAIKSWKKKPYLLWMKNSRLVRSARFHAASALEKTHIAEVFGKGADTRVAPDLPESMELPPLQEKPKEPGSLRLVSIARISPEKNLFYALGLLAKIQGRIGFDIFGPVYDKAYWDKCRALIARLPDRIQCRYHGPLAKEELPARLGQAHFLFLPSRGESFGHAILEALSRGVPVIISDQTPWRDLERDKAGSDIPLERQGVFARFLNEAVAMDAAGYKIWARGARARADAFIKNPDLLRRSVELFG